MSKPSSSPTSTVSPPTPPPPGPRYHPDFTDSSGLNADVTLVARDKMHFRINAAILRSASGVFETTLSLPQPVETGWKEPVIDSLDEHSAVLEDLLKIISNKEIDPKRFISLDVLQPRLLAAEKWDMGGVLSIMRILLRTNPDISSSDPVRVYWLGSHFGWRDVTSAASKYFCNAYLFRAEKQSLLGQIDATDLLRLMKLHKTRKDKMKEHLLGSTVASHYHTSFCSHQERMSAEYRDFTWGVLREMDHTPPACKIPEDKLLSIIKETELSVYQCRGCNRPALPCSDILAQIHRCWNTLQTMTI